MAAKRQLKGGFHTTRLRYYFAQDAFDFFFTWVLGGQTHGASEVGEAFTTAARITEGDPESWVAEWLRMGRQVADLAAESLDRGHRVSAREAFCRAYTYTRVSLIQVSPLQDPRLREIYEEARGYMLQAAPLFDPPVEPLSIPFEGKSLPGYFLRPDASGRKRKTLIMIGGGDTFVEDLLLYIGPAGLKRGYNVLVVDLPGQGILPSDGLPMRPDVEGAMQAVVDAALSRPEVDPDRLAAYGISGGGYLVPRAACYEKRLKAIVACSMILDFYRHFAENTKLLRFAAMEGTWKHRLFMWLYGRRFRAAMPLMDSYKWRWGVKSLRELVGVLRSFVFDPAQITCPTLIIIGQEEYEDYPCSREFQDTAMAAVQHPVRRLIQAPVTLGAGTHAMSSNLSLMSRYVFDFLDEVWEA